MASFARSAPPRESVQFRADLVWIGAIDRRGLIVEKISLLVLAEQVALLGRSHVSRG